MHRTPWADTRTETRIVVTLLWGLLLIAAVQRAWNAWSVPPLLGFDAPAHAAYVFTIRTEGRLPDPLEGWSTFHPPLYYLLGALAWRALEPFGPQAVVAGLRGLGALAGLGAGLVTFVLARRLRLDPAPALLATALVLFVPCAQLSAAMAGNEAFAAGVAALALLPLTTLQRDPRDLRAALFTGLAAGIALASKFSGLYVAGACVVPFLRRDLDARMAKALVLSALATALVAGPVYVRNLALTGEITPMTRERNPMRRAEASLILGPRRLADYVHVPRECITHPYIRGWELVAQQAWLFRKLNAPMRSVPGLTYASTWNDAFRHRFATADTARIGAPLALLGLVPSALTVLGLLLAIRSTLRSRGRCAEAPLVAMTLLGLLAFLGFTWRAPSLAAVKASYLLPLAVPAGIFFARGMGILRGWAYTTALTISAVAVVAAGVAFTEGLLFASPPLGTESIATWSGFAAELPHSNIVPVLRYLVPPA